MTGGRGGACRIKMSFLNAIGGNTPFLVLLNEVFIDILGLADKFLSRPRN